MARTRIVKDTLGVGRRTNAYERVLIGMDRMSILLDVGLVGFSSAERSHKSLFQKAKHPGVPGPEPHDYAPDMEFVVDEGGKSVTVTADLRVFQTIRKVVSMRRQHYQDARFHLYSMLAVSLWAAYETYVVIVLEELYRARPQLLKSKEQIDYASVVDNAADPSGALIERQLNTIGHLSFMETVGYLASRINYRLAEEEQKTLQSFYVLRNVVAHGTGVVRERNAASLPKDVGVEGGELRLTKHFLARMKRVISRSVRRLEHHVQAKFFSRRTGA